MQHCIRCSNMKTRGLTFVYNVTKYRSVDNEGSRRLKWNNTIPETLQQPRENGEMTSVVRNESFCVFASLRLQSGKRQLNYKARQKFTTRPLSRETIVGR